MTTLSSLSFWLFFIIFFIAIFFSFYIPGSLLLKKSRLSPFPHIIISIITGMTLWGWQGFIFGFLGIRWMTYVYLLLFFFFWIKTDEKKKILSFVKNFTFKRFGKLDILLVSLVAIGTLMQMTSVFFVGILTKTGMFFCCTPPDALYHIALTNQLVKEFPPTEPGMAGVVVHNYHYMSNLVMADLIRIFHLPLIATVYQYFVVLLSLFIGLTAIAFGKIIKMKEAYIRWLVFFLYFSGDMTYVLTFLTGRGFNFTIPFLENALWLWVSPPRVFATVVFFAAITLLYLWIKQKKFLTGLLMAFVFASLVSFKIYVGIFMAAGVAGLFIYFVFAKQFRMIIPLIITGILSLILYLPVNASSGGLVFTGFWQFQNFVVQPNLHLTNLEMAREIYEAHHNWFGVARFEFLFIVLYLVFVFGTVILGIFQSKKSLSLFPPELNIFLLSGIGVSMLFGFLFIQTSGGANSVQFLITFDILGSIYAALACFYWLDKMPGKAKFFVTLIIIFFTIPRIIDIEHDYISELLYSPSLFIDNNQLQALQYLKTNTPNNSILLADNLESKSGYIYDPGSKQLYSVPINTGGFLEGNFSYDVSFLSDRSMFIDGDMFTNSIVQSHGVNTDRRVNVERTIFADKNPKLMRTLLHKNNISYIYLGSTTKLAKMMPSFLRPVYRNTEVTIFKVT